MRKVTSKIHDSEHLADEPGDLAEHRLRSGVAGSCRGDAPGVLQRDVRVLLVELAELLRVEPELSGKVRLRQQFLNQSDRALFHVDSDVEL